MAIADLIRILDKARDDLPRIHEEVVEECFESITEGSALTGAPGQPVRTGKTKAAWGKEDEGRFRTLIYNPLPHASKIEDGHQDIETPTGGPHSMKLTAAAFDRIVEDVVRRVV